MTLCYVCPHRCGVDRPANMSDTTGCFGSCGVGLAPIVARAGLHMWEEPVISGTKGSGTVFFSGCNLHCVFCQNYDISCKGFGKEITVERLKEIYHELIAQGAHNINLVTPTHFTEAVLQSLDEPLLVPVVYNTSGFETQDTLRRLKGKVQIYLPDLKYSDDMAAIKYSNAPYYFRIATEAIKEMYNQVGDYHIDDNGIMTKGVIIRHLIMPGMPDNTKRIIDWVAANFKPGQVMFTSTFPAAAPANIPKSTARLRMRNTRSWKAICCKALSKTALYRKEMPPARISSPALTEQEYKNIFALNFIK